MKVPFKPMNSTQRRRGEGRREANLCPRGGGLGGELLPQPPPGQIGCRRATPDAPRASLSAGRALSQTPVHSRECPAHAEPVPSLLAA